MPEARLIESDEGMTADSDGWFVVNLAGARAMAVSPFGIAATFEPAGTRFPHFGINVHLLDPGEPNGVYHSETAQEAFLVLSGECTLVVEDTERRLGPWDFFHCPPGTPHILVGAGEGTCAVLMVGARDGEHGIRYPVSAAAGRYGASVAEETDDPRTAYARAGPAEHRPLPWPPGSDAA